MNFKVNDAAIIGAGFMGYSIAFLCAQNGIRTVNVDVSQEQINTAKTKTNNLLIKLLDKEKINIEDSKNIKKNLVYSTDYIDIKDSQVVIEAVPEIHSLLINIQIQKFSDMLMLLKKVWL